MLGYAGHREAFVWVETRDAQKVALKFWLAGQPATARTIENTSLAVTPAGGQITHFRPGLLEMGSTYEYQLEIDGVAQELSFPARFRTQELWEWRKDPPNFSFVVGSCAYINDPAYDRPGKPYGRTTETLRLAGESGANFMVWLGDNWYYREADYDSVSGLWYRAQHDRGDPSLRRLLGSMHHYAVWDDHDYGPDDANFSYEYKRETLKIFKSYWGNHSYGEEGQPGVYNKFYWSDAAFILMDNHWYRDDALVNQDTHPGKTQWGRRQLEWLKQSLLSAKSLDHFTFKFIATGNQMLQTTPDWDTHALYRAEREELLQFITDNGITGVIFLTGDVHHAGVYRRQLSPDGPWVYEVTASPLTSGVEDPFKRAKDKDPFVLKHTLVADQNFVQVSVSGPTTDRAVEIKCIDKQGAVRFLERLKATDLGYVAPSGK